MRDFYSSPHYYEIAFSFRDIGHEFNVFEECFRRYSKIPVRQVLELGSGPSPHLEEFARRGYDYIGLDCNPVMLDYAQQKARSLGMPATFIQADMRQFALEIPVDFAYVLLGSLYAETTEDVLSHLAAAAHVLQSGGSICSIGVSGFSGRRRLSVSRAGR
ncbi:MAG: class I SAM-dependent methyltransferase [Candidatus Latescibacteria bacterium]|nr:class I SAM-dependent methyltransferase [Candidatus Latescibacterota bacterium]